MARREEWQEQKKLARLLDKSLDPACTFWTATVVIGVERRDTEAGQCSRSQRAVREAMLRAGDEWWECRSAHAAMWALRKSGVKFRTIVHEDGKIECWQQPKLPAWEVLKRNPHERRPRAPEWEPGAAAEVAELAAASDDGAGGDIAA
jgi:hypothetical protein